MANVSKRVRPRPGKPDLVTWEVRWRDPNGRQKRKSFPKKSDAERYQTTVQTRLVGGEYIDPDRGRVTFADLAEEYMAGRTALKPKTLAGYRSLLDTWVLPTWGITPIRRISYVDVRDWVVWMSERLSASRTRQAYFLLTSVLDEAVKARRLAVNPARRVELPRIPRSERRYLTPEQAAKLAVACGDDGDIVRVLVSTGIRWGEMAGLRVRDVGRDSIHIAQAMTEINGIATFGPPKNHQDRWVGLPAPLRERLALRLEGKGPDDLVFTTRRGRPMRVQNWRRDCFGRAAAEIGMPDLVPHELRHTAAALAIASGADVKDVQNMLGHSSAAMTLDRYGHLMDGSPARMAERMANAVPW